MTTAIIVQARMTSTRLPGKVLMQVLGKPLLAYQIERLRRVQHAEKLIIATTTQATDDPIVSLCKALGVETFRGSEADVLGRYYGAACQGEATTVVRVTSDCPLIDPAVIDAVIERYQQNGGTLGFVSNTLERTYPQGMDTEVFSFQALREAHQEATRPEEREHVTPFIYRHPERYPQSQVTYHTDHHQHRWTVDTPDDFALIEQLLTALYPNHPEFTLEDLLEALAEHPEWVQINAHIQQKKVENV